MRDPELERQFLERFDDPADRESTSPHADTHLACGCALTNLMRSQVTPCLRVLVLARCLRQRRRMSHKTVQLVIGWLLTDEDLRHRFIERPRQTLTELREQGYEFTAAEFEALLLCDPAMWASTAERIHPDLKRVSLHPR
jgi:hypothetical protein